MIRLENFREKIYIPRYSTLPKWESHRSNSVSGYFGRLLDWRTPSEVLVHGWRIRWMIPFATIPYTYQENNTWKLLVVVFIIAQCSLTARQRSLACSYRLEFCTRSLELTSCMKRLDGEGWGLENESSEANQSWLTLEWTKRMGVFLAWW